MNYKSFSDLSIDITSNLYQLYSKEYDLIVGIPRSGMIPAYMIGLQLNVSVTSLDSFINNGRLHSGLTRKVKGDLVSAWDAKRILLVDDSISSGRSMLTALASIPNVLIKNVDSCAIYSSLKNRSDVDIYFEHVSLPRVFEWNIFHRKLMERACLDIDGVLCLDPTGEQNDDGEKYIDFLLNAQPLYIPTNKVKALVTNRLEKYRKETELWLKNNNVEYEHLIMLDLPSKEERQRLKIHASHKSCYYIESNLDLFVESEQSQAIAIMKDSGKPVYCSGDQRMYTPGMSLTLIKSPNTLLNNIKRTIDAKLPSRIMDILRPIYIFIFK